MKFFLFICGLFMSLNNSSFAQSKAPFDGERFDNLEPVPDKPFSSVIKWRWTSEQTPWPAWVDSLYGSVLKKRTAQGEIHWSVVNHATVLIQVDGVNILTDPVWSERTSPFGFIGPKRVRNPGIKFEDLPPIDFVLISHNHYDHMDLPTLAKLKHAFDPTFIVGLRNRGLLESVGIERIIEMDWWEKHQFGALSIGFVPAQHWSARGLFDKRKMLWGGFIIEASSRIYFAGDTGWGSFFKQIKEKIGAPDLAFIPIGAYAPRWFMKAFHINPEEAVQAHLDLGAKSSVGIHFGTFQLTDEGIDDPMKQLELAKEKLQVQDFVVPKFGESVIFSKGETHE